jgi:hypothetical protein
MSASVFTRPNGKTYRPRKPPVASQFADPDGDFGGVVVQRTHDIDTARRLAQNVLDEYEMDPDAFERVWWRLGISDNGLMWLDDPTRGVPCIVWRYEW